MIVNHGNNYRFICIFRYEGVIANQFYGHTHYDSYFLFYDEKSNFTRPTNVGYVSPSVVTYSNLNPGYRIYTVDGFYPGSTFVSIVTTEMSL